MALDLEFNDPLVLKGYLNQAFKQMEIDSEKIVVGDKGGLAYLLFETSKVDFPVSCELGSITDFNTTANYVGEVKSYLNLARAMAKQYDFKEVLITEDIITEMHDAVSFYKMGIGDNSIDNPEKLEKFLEMVKIVEKPLDEIYGKIIELAEQVPRIST